MKSVLAAIVGFACVCTSTLGTVVSVPASNPRVYSGVQASGGEVFNITAVGTVDLATGGGGYLTLPNGVIVGAPLAGSGAEAFFTGQLPVGVIPIVGGVKFVGPGCGDCSLPGGAFGALTAGFATTPTPTDFGPANFPAGLVAVGMSGQVTAPVGGGYLFLCVNDLPGPDNTGAYVASVTQAAMWHDEFANFAAGDLVGQSGWVQQGVAATLPLQVVSGRLVMPGGQTVDNQDASKAMVVPGTHGTSAVFGMRFRVDSAPSVTTPFYVAGLVGSNGFVNARIAVRRQVGGLGDYEIGVRATGQAGNPFQWWSGWLFGRENVIIVAYDFSSTTSNDDVVSLYINPIHEQRALNLPISQVQSVANSDMPSCSAFVFSQFASATISTPGFSVRGIAAGDSFAEVFHALVSPPLTQDAVWQNVDSCDVGCFNVLQNPGYWAPGLPGALGRATFGSWPGALQYVDSLTADARFGSMAIDNQFVSLNATGHTVDAGELLVVADNDGETASLSLTGGLLTLGSDASGDSWVGSGVGASGQINVTGSTAVFKPSVLRAGAFSGTGAVAASNGGVIDATNALVLGENSGEGSLLVETGASVDAGFLVVVNGLATIRTGGELTTRGGQVMDTAIITGAGSKLISQTDGSFGSDFQVGLGGNSAGRIEIRDGGLVQVTQGNTFVGRESTGLSTALVTGAGSAWTNQGEFIIGGLASGSTVVEQGATLSCMHLRVGDNGSGELIVRSGGVVTSSSEAPFGGPPSGSANVLVTGPGSMLSGWGGVKGGYSPCTVVVSDGAVMRSGPNPPAYTWNDYIGTQSTGEVTITGPGSAWENIAGLWVGGIYFSENVAGHGVLNVLNGGSVSGRGPVYVGAGADAMDTGRLVLGAGASLSTEAATAAFVGHPAAPAASSELLGQGGLVRGAVTMNAGGIVRGTLDIQPNVGTTPSPSLTLLSGSGILEPGEGGVAPFGVISVNGSAQSFGESVVTAAATVRMDIGGTGPGQFDRIAATGTFRAGGTLVLTFLAYTPQIGDAWDLITAASVTGTFSTIVGAGDIGAGKYLVVESTPTAVRLRCVQINALVLTPSSVEVVQGFSARLHAVAATSSGDIDMSSQATWSSSDGVIATVDATGLIQGQGLGLATVTATVGAHGASAGVTVTPLPAELRTERVSLTNTSAQIAGASLSPVVSADGRFVAFASTASAVGAADTNNRQDVYLRDTQLNTTALVSVRPDGAAGTFASLSPAMSPDGRFIVFYSLSADLVAGDANAVHDTFIRDTLTGTTEIVSLASDGSQGGASSVEGIPSATGALVAFTSSASNLIPGDTNNVADIFLRDRASGTTTRLSVSADGSVSGGTGVYGFTPDGRFVVFYSSYALVPEDTNVSSDLYLRDLTLGTIERISVGTGGVQANGGSVGYGQHVVSEDGRYVVFQSLATNLVPGDTNGQRDMFIRDRQLGTTTLVNAKSDGTPTAGGVGSVSISGNGRIAIWRCPGADTVPFDTNGVDDVFVKDLVTGQVRRISVSPFDSQSDGYSRFCDASRDGRMVVFESAATNFAPFDTNQSSDIFRRRVTVPICSADIDDSGSLGVQDIFDFLRVWFEGGPVADYNRDGNISVQDIFDFLAGWFAGCV